MNEFMISHSTKSKRHQIQAARWKFRIKNTILFPQKSQINRAIDCPEMLRMLKVYLGQCIWQLPHQPCLVPNHVLALLLSCVL